jgi:hypothetical protein
MNLQIQSVIEKSALRIGSENGRAGLTELRAFAVGRPPISSPLWPKMPAAIAAQLLVSMVTTHSPLIAAAIRCDYGRGW